MQSLFNKQDAESFIQRINKISSETRPAWGKMNASQLMAHCNAALEMAHGEIKSKRTLIGFLFGRSILKKLLMPGAEMPKNTPTDPNFVFPDTVEFEKAKEKLINRIRLFSDKGASAITKEKHPFFGDMSTEQWDQLQVKHLNHHLKQFGV